VVLHGNQPFKLLEVDADESSVGLNEQTSELVKRLAALFENARRVPLLRDRVRVDKHDALKLIDALSQRSQQELTTTPASTDLTTVLSELREMLKRAYPIPFTEQVRIPTERANAAAASLHAIAEG
jgi:hypothetical protein